MTGGTGTGQNLEAFRSGNWPVDETNTGNRKIWAAFPICKNIGIPVHPCAQAKTSCTEGELLSNKYFSKMSLSYCSAHFPMFFQAACSGWEGTASG